MKLFLLRPIQDLKGFDPWEPWYDKSFGHVVRCETEEEAHKMANDAGGDEKGPRAHHIYNTGGDPWLDPLFSTCVELLPKGEPGIIITDFAST